MAGTILPAISLVLNLSAFSIEYIDALKFCWEKLNKHFLKSKLCGIYGSWLEAKYLTHE